MELSEHPLVSIIVITYNSSKFVLETLESAKAQTYQNIELIVSDDASTDNTVEICKEWIDKNKNRFVRTELITVEKNTGISANCNRGVKVAKGEWLKFIAGDDYLTKDAISALINFTKKYNNVSIFCGNAIKIDEKGNILGKIFRKDNTYSFKLWRVLGEGGIIAPTAFINKTVLLKLGGFSEEFVFEDYPFWLKTLYNKFKILYVNYDICYYRKYNKSVSFNYSLSLDILKVQSEYKNKYYFPFSINLYHYIMLAKNLNNDNLKNAFKESLLIIKKFPISIFVFFFPKLYYFILKYLYKKFFQ